MEIILASTSPRRKELLAMIVNNFRSVSPLVEEDKIMEENAIERCKKLSREKCKAVVSYTNSKCVVIASDTVVELNGEILEKPKNRKQAFEMIKKYLQVGIKYTQRLQFS